MSGRDVDAIWAQLKAKAAPKPGPTTTGQAELERLMRQINSGMGMEGTSSNVAGGMQLPGVAAAAPRSSLAHSNSGTAARPQQVQQADGASASATALSCTGEELGTLLEQQLPRHVSALQDGSSTAQSRRAALQEIKVGCACSFVWPWLGGGWALRWLHASWLAMQAPHACVVCKAMLFMPPLCSRSISKIACWHPLHAASLHSGAVTAACGSATSPRGPDPGLVGRKGWQSAVKEV